MTAIRAMRRLKSALGLGARPRTARGRLRGAASKEQAGQIASDLV